MRRFLEVGFFFMLPMSTLIYACVWAVSKLIACF